MLKFTPISGGMDSFHDEHGEPIQFSYTPNFGRLAYEAIPDPRSDPNADADTVRGFRQWFGHESRYGFESAIWGCIRAVSDVAGSPRVKGPKGDWNGDNFAAGILGVIEAFCSAGGGPYDPGADDEVAFVEPEFWAPIAKARQPATFDKAVYEVAEADNARRASKTKSHYYVRWAKRAADSAIYIQEKQVQPPPDEDGVLRRCEQLEADLDSGFIFNHIRFRRRDDRKSIWCSYDSQEPWQIQSLQENSQLDGKDSWLTKWISENVTDPIKRRIMEVKAENPSRTQRQIINIVNYELGTNYRYEKVRRTLREVETLFRASRDEFDIRDTSGKKRDRAGGAVIEWPIHGARCDLPIGKLEAAAQYDLDEDGWKKRSGDGRIVRRQAA